LAEAELEYYQNHESPSAYVGLEVNTSIDDFLKKIGASIEKPLEDGTVEAVIWTTTPWTLPANKAIAFHKAETYSVLDARQTHKKAYYIVATSLLDQFFFEKNRKYNVICEFSGQWYSDSLKQKYKMYLC
jgi:isoleucyl-tRNA synthetase